MKCLITIAMIGGYVSAGAQDAGFRIQAVGSVSVLVTVDKMTNLLFPEAIQTGVKVSQDVLVQKVKGVENVIELKAVRRGFTPTNLSVYGRDGRLYSFTLRYVEDTAVLNYRVIAPAATDGDAVLLTDLPASETRLREDAERLEGAKRFLKVAGRSEGLRLRLTGVYLRDSLEWLVFELSNRTAVPYRPAPLRVSVVEGREVKRKAEQELQLAPVYAPGWTGEGRTMRIAVGFQPFTVKRGKRLVVEVRGKDGRMVVVKVKGRILLRVRRG